MKRLIAKPRYGLANRLRFLSCADALARMSGRSLQVIWMADEECGSKLSDLFTNRFDMLDTYVPGEDAKVYNFIYLEGGLSAENRLVSLFDEQPIVYIESAYIFRLKWKCNPFLRIFQKVLSRYFGIQSDSLIKRLNPTPYIESRILELNVNDMVGIHVRTPNTQIDHKSLTAANFKKSTLDNFKRKISSIVQENSGQKFFLSTSDLTVQDDLVKSFPGRIVYLQSKNLSRSETTGIQDAVADMFLLSKTRKILGTYYSTFGRLAALRGGIPIEIIL